MNFEEDDQAQSKEQRMAIYRQRIRDKLQKRGCPTSDLDRRTEELMHRKLPLNFTAMAQDAS